jgi:histidinol-phosphate aminotransferase
MSTSLVGGTLEARAKLPVRDAYRDIQPYAGSGDTRAAVDLSDNTNLWGAPPAAVRALIEGISLAPRYPTVYARERVSALARRLDVSPDMVVTGCGSDDVLDAAFRALARPGDRVAMGDPTFPMAATFARMNGLTPVAVPVKRDADLDVVGLVRARAALTYVASPNNPTGVVTPIGALAALAAESNGFVIIDAAYADFAGTYRAELTDLVRRSTNVFMVQTLSKAWGLAGLRVGYGVGDAALVREVEKARGPYKVNTLAERAAIAALESDAAWVDARVAEAVANRGRLVAELARLGLASLPSGGNFVFVPLASRTGGAPAFAAALRRADVGVRVYTGLTVIGDGVRITVGPWPLMERLLEAIRGALAHEAVPAAPAPGDASTDGPSSKGIDA